MTTPGATWHDHDRRRDRQHQRRSAGRRGRRRARPQRAGGRVTRPPGGAGSTGGGRRRPAPTCWCRCCSATVPDASARADAAGGAGRRRRRAREVAGVVADAEVAERPAARRAQAGRRARPGRRQRAPAYVVVGIGLNVGWAPDGAARLGDGIDPADVLDALLVAYDRLPADIADLLPGRAWHARPVGPRRAQRTATSSAGRSTCCPTAGSWCSTSAAITHRFDTGDVVHLR